MSQLDTPLGGLVRQRDVPPAMSVNHPSPQELAKQLFTEGPLNREYIGPNGQRAMCSVLDLMKRDPIPTPPQLLREGYGKEGDQMHMAMLWWYWYREARRISDFMAFARPASGKFKVMDFGCATGRILRYFVNQDPDCQPHGCDYDNLNVEWMKRHLPPSVRVFQNHSIPHLPIRDSSLDALYALSVFTHMDLLEDAWLLELSRIVRPGGCLFLTFHSEVSWAEGWRRERWAESVTSAIPDRAGLPQGEELREAPMPSGRTVFRSKLRNVYSALTMHSEEYVLEHWGKFFSNIEIVHKFAQHEGGFQSAAIITV